VWPEVFGGWSGAISAQGRCLRWRASASCSRSPLGPSPQWARSRRARAPPRPQTCRRLPRPTRRADAPRASHANWPGRWPGPTVPPCPRAFRRERSSPW